MCVRVRRISQTSGGGKDCHTQKGSEGTNEARERKKKEAKKNEHEGRERTRNQSPISSFLPFFVLATTVLVSQVLVKIFKKKICRRLKTPGFVCVKVLLPVCL